MSSQKFFVMAKPDACKRGLVGEIIFRFEKKGFKMLKLELRDASKCVYTIEMHYAEHQIRPFYDSLIEFTSTGQICCMVWEGNIQVARTMVGSTLPWEAKAGTIRGDYACCLPANLIHCSDGSENAIREVNLWFPETQFQGFDRKSEN